MRILHVSDHTLHSNGMVHAAVDLACAQAALGHDVIVCSSGGSFDKLLCDNGVRLAVIRTPTGISSRFLQMYDVLKVVRSYKPDVVHAHMTISALMAWPITRLLGIPFVTVVQNSFSKMAAVMRLGDLVITGCNAVADAMVPRGIPRRKLRPVLNGTIGSARFPGAAVASTQMSRPAVVSVCGLHPRKGIPDLISALEMARRAIPDLHLYHVGGGPCAAEYQALVSEEHRDFIHFCGPSLDPRPYLLGADVFVLASLADPAPLVIAEAREAGLAVVATRVDGIPELLENGAAGILVPPSAPNAIAQELIGLFSNPDNLRRWRTASQVGVEKLTVKRVAESTVDVYAEAINRRGFKTFDALRNTEPSL